MIRAINHLYLQHIGKSRVSTRVNNRSGRQPRGPPDEVGIGDVDAFICRPRWLGNMREALAEFVPGDFRP